VPLPKYFKITMLFVLALMAGTAAGWAQRTDQLPEKPRLIMPVEDFAGVLDAGEEASLNQKLIGYADSSSTEILVITVPDLGGRDVAEYATALGQKWQIGQKGKDNGVVILAAINDRKINISVGRGLEDKLTDMTAGQIIRNEITPAFREGNYYLGFSRAADAIIEVTKGTYKGNPKEKDEPGAGSILLIVLLIITALVFASRKGGGGGGGYMSRRGYGGFGGGFLGGSIFGSTLGGGGWGSGGGGGGFGGFGGGGSFGGGGASGSW